MKQRILLLLIAVSPLHFVLAQSNKARHHEPPGKTVYTGNPLFPGWYADPDATVFGKEYWIYPTFSAKYNEQVFIDAFSSTDLTHWVKHSHVLDTARVKWAHRAVWAPAIVHKGNKYFLFFGANDIQNDEQVGGIGVAEAGNPAGPFKDHIGHPLIDKFHNGAQPIDQCVFKDTDGQYYILYGGWRHCNIARLNNDFTGLVPFPDGSTYKEITPKGYVEGAYMLKRNNKYYFMWSEGGWTGPDYCVAYAMGNSPLGPFERIGKVLVADTTIATGAGHHGILYNPNRHKYYIVYHRRPHGDTEANHRVTCLEPMEFDKQGYIKPVHITKNGVKRETVY